MNARRRGLFVCPKTVILWVSGACPVSDAGSNQASFREFDGLHPEFKVLNALGLSRRWILHLISPG